LETIPRILITPGEPAGIGPDITIKIAQAKWAASLIAVCDPDLLRERAKLLNLPLKILDSTDSEEHIPGTLTVLPTFLKTKAIPGKLNSENARYVIECLTIAAERCLQKKADALVTGPVQKSILNESGIPFSGHTEFLANVCKTPHVLMLFVVDKLRVALLTTHVPLKDVPGLITQEKIINTVRLLNSEMKKKFGFNEPNILVAGLNPHAGESGHLGREEIEIIGPAIQLLQKEKMAVQGPVSADTIFFRKESDVILAMYHDQALPVVKYAGFDHAVNVTLGLPIIRTSVDHGTALDIAGHPNTNAGSLAAAIKLAIDLV